MYFLAQMFGDSSSAEYLAFLPLVVQCAFSLAVMLYIRRRMRGQQQPLAEAAALAERLADFRPEELVPDVAATHPALRPRLVSGRVGRRICVDGVDCLNMASQNFLGLLDEEEVVEDAEAGGICKRDQLAIECINANGVGTCGPRGFYGTNAVHLELEERIARFMGCEEAAIYAYGFSALASAIPSYCKRGDLVFADERVNFAIQHGLEMSRSTVVYFKHNDAADLERHLQIQRQLDQRNPKKAAAQRRFLVTEAIFQNTGEMCPLPRLVELRAEYKLRMILDESLSFGTVGANGRGLTELLNVDLKEVDLIVGSLETAIGSIGGFCVGTTYIVDHQRLSGLAYCFSASAPPFLARVAIHSLQELEDRPQIVAELNVAANRVQKAFSRLQRFTLTGHPLSPVKHLYLAEQPRRRSEEELQIRGIVAACSALGLAITQSEYLEEKERSPCPRPSIRLAVSRLLTAEDVEFAVQTLERATEAILRAVSADGEKEEEDTDAEEEVEKE